MIHYFSTVRPTAALRAASALILATTLTACGSSSNNNHNHNDNATQPTTVDAGALRLVISESPWGMRFLDEDGEDVLAEFSDTGVGPFGTLGVFPGPPAEGSGTVATMAPLEMGQPAIPPHREQGWVRATALESSSMEGDTWTGTLATTDPEISLTVRAWADSDGVIAVAMSASGAAVQASSIAFAASENERFVGFGERGNAVNQAGNIIENYVAEGPYQDAEYTLINLLVPTWGVRWRPDTTYFPIPWLLSSRGYGVLLDNNEISYHRLGNDDTASWAVETEASMLQFRVFAGPQPADALARFSEALGRQPDNYAPWFFGPWVQPDRDTRIDELRAADVPTSVTATYTHYLPCGSQRGNEDGMLARTAARNAAGTAVHTYLNPMICTDFQPEYGLSASLDALVKNVTDEPYLYDYQTSRTFTVSQFDFSTSAGVNAYKTLTDEAIAHGYEGWMEDFGEYTPLDAVSADGLTGTAFHNRYPRDYHCGVAKATQDAGKPLARFVRSGWTGSAACSPIVWGGDPTVSFGFDGLESSIYQALSMGTSGVGLWGSDIGGFFALPPNAITAELLDRWIAFGAMSVIMRSQKDGLKPSSIPRAQPWDPEHISLWRKYAKLHTQLYPYIQAAAETYYATGMPVMRHHLLSDPLDDRAHARDDQYLFGPDLLVAPVYTDGATTRALYLPKGEWIEWWRSVQYAESDGSFSLSALNMHAGETDVTVAAPQDEIPLFVRAGAVIPLLAADVYTLAPHGADDPSVVRLDDRADQLHLLAFPRGESSGAFFDTGTYLSTESATGWTLTIEDSVKRTIHLQASMQTLTDTFTPCSVSVGDTTLAPTMWDYNPASGVLSAQYENTLGPLLVRGC